MQLYQGREEKCGIVRLRKLLLKGESDKLHWQETLTDDTKTSSGLWRLFTLCHFDTYEKVTLGSVVLIWAKKVEEWKGFLIDWLIGCVINCVFPKERAQFNNNFVQNSPETLFAVKPFSEITGAEECLNNSENKIQSFSFGVKDNALRCIVCRCFGATNKNTTCKEA